MPVAPPSISPIAPKSAVNAASRIPVLNKFIGNGSLLLRANAYMMAGRWSFNMSREPEFPEVSQSANKPPPAAMRAIEEAAARRKAAGQPEKTPENGGPPGPEPTRHGDWEKNGRAIDF